RSTHPGLCAVADSRLLLPGSVTHRPRGWPDRLRPGLPDRRLVRDQHRDGRPGTVRQDRRAPPDRGCQHPGHRVGLYPGYGCAGWSVTFLVGDALTAPGIIAVVMADAPSCSAW